MKSLEGAPIPPHDKGDDSARERIKNFTRAAIVTAGSLLPHPEHGTPNVPDASPVTYSTAESQDTQAEQQHETSSLSESEQSDEVNIARLESADKSSELSTDELIARYNLATDSLEQLRILLNLSSRDVPETTREALLKDYAKKFFDDASTIVGALEDLEMCGVRKNETPWLKDMFDDFILNNPEQIAALQPVWPDNPPDEGHAALLERRLGQYTQFRSALDDMDAPKARVIIEILDGTESSMLKEDLMYFVDDIARGTLKLEDAARMVRDDEQLFEYLLERVQNGEQVSSEHMARLRGLANPYLPRRERLERVLSGT